MFDFLSKPKTAQEPVGLRQQIADWAVRLPPSWPSWARTSLVVAVMLIVGTLSIRRPGPAITADLSPRPGAVLQAKPSLRTFARDCKTDARGR
jgi:hypothetical protein